jgi:hypothetical protein
VCCISCSHLPKPLLPGRWISSSQRPGPAGGPKSNCRQEAATPWCAPSPVKQQISGLSRTNVARMCEGNNPGMPAGHSRSMRLRHCYFAALLVWNARFKHLRHGRGFASMRPQQQYFCVSIAVS